jgi:hypothetical protein
VNREVLPAVTWFHQFGQTEGEQLYVAIVGDHDVTGLQVAVNNACAVGQTFSLDGIFQGFIQRSPSRGITW